MTWVTRIFQPASLTASGGTATLLDNAVFPTVIRGMVFSYVTEDVTNVTLDVWITTSQGNTAWLVNGMLLSPGDRVEWDVPITLDVGDSIQASSSADTIYASVWGVVNE